MKRIAVVILNWNGAEMLQRFLPEVVRNSPEAEVIVADNGSTDASLCVMKQAFPEVSLIALGENFGFAEGYNRALQALPHEFLLLLNSDVAPAPGWLAPLLRYMDAHPEVAAAQPKLLAVDRPDHFEYAGGAGGYLDRLGYPYCRGRVFGTVERDAGQYDAPAPVFWATGAALLIRRADWHAVGGLDGRFFAHQEEIDLCWRLRARGRGVACVPQSVAYHVGGASLPQGNPRKTFLNFRNNLLLLYKNLPEAELRPVLRARFWLDYLAALQFLLSGDVRGAWAVRRARCEFARLRPDFQAARRENLRAAAAHPAPSRIPRCLLWAYYVRGRKTFASLHA